MELYNGIINTLTRTKLESKLLGRHIVLLLNFLSRACFIKQYYQDLIVIIYKCSSLSPFITFTTNFNWDKITYKLLFSQTVINMPNLVIYIFYIKLNYFIYNLKRKQIFSQYHSYIQTIKYQKQGLFYLHLLFFDRVYRELYIPNTQLKVSI